MNAANQISILNKATDVILKNFVYILIYAIVDSEVNVSNFTGSSLPLLDFMLAVVSFIVSCGVFSLLWQYTQKGKYDLIKGIKANFAGYLCVTIFTIIIITVVTVGTSLAFKGDMALKTFEETRQGKLLMIIFIIAFQLIFVYVLPLVFVKNMGVQAIPKGVNFLFDNIKKSALPLLIALCNGIVISTAHAFGSFFSQHLILLVIQRHIISFLMFLSFLTASMILDSALGLKDKAVTQTLIIKTRRAK